MDVDDCVLSAGRAVLDMVEQEWQPLSPGELEQRLDQAVEEILEAELMAKLKSQPSPTIYVQLLQNQATVSPQVPQSTADEELQEPRVLPAVDSEALKSIADLLQTSDSRSRMSGRARLSLSNTVLLSLSLLTERVSYRSLSRRFHLEKGNIHRIFFSFCERVNTLEEKLIKWPTDTEAAEVLVPLCRFEKVVEEQQGLPQVLGVLGHTLIPTRLPAGKAGVESAACEAKRMRKETHPDSWLSLELVCDSKGRLRHCRISPGSDADRGRSLRDKLRQHPELMPSGSCLVAGPGYPLTASILTPYSGSPGAKEKLFNETLEEHFSVLDRTLASLRARFQRLGFLDVSSFHRARAVVLTACVLHNVFLGLGRAVEGDVEKEQTAGQEEEGEEDGEGVERRDAISDLLFKYLDSGTT